MGVAAVCCPACGEAGFEDLFSLEQLPVCVNARVEPDAAPLVDRGDIDLVVCTSCAHLFNRSFDTARIRYDAAYENTLHYSPRFREFATDLAERLVNGHHLNGRSAVEIGSGPGHFLRALCDAGMAGARGWDPSHDPARLESPDDPRISVTREPFPADGSIAADLYLSQHVLEHLADPVLLLDAMSKSAERHGGVVYSEVPNGTLMLEHGAIWDLVYEHVSYFVPTSLEAAHQRGGLRSTAQGSAFGEQFLWCEAEADRPSIGWVPDARAVLAGVEQALTFAADIGRRMAHASDTLDAALDAGPVALWGAGSKGVTYLNIVTGAGRIEAVVDVNPRKWGAGIAGTHHVVRSSQSLVGVRPRTVLVANPVYVDEIRCELASVGVRADVAPIWT